MSIKSNKAKRRWRYRITTKYLFSYDTRGQSHAEARHWSEEKILGGRAFFRGDLKPARLVIDNVKGTDAGDYRCRADFYRAPTTISHMRLDVIGMVPFGFGIFSIFSFILISISVPPQKPKIHDERGQEVRLKLGPYRIGDTVTLKCTAYGGKSKIEFSSSMSTFVNLFSASLT